MYSGLSSREMMHVRLLLSAIFQQVYASHTKEEAHAQVVHAYNTNPTLTYNINMCVLSLFQSQSL